MLIKRSLAIEKGRGLGTRFLCLEQSSRELYRNKNDLDLCFVDFEKAFDMVRHEVLVERLRGLGIDVADLTLMETMSCGKSWR